MENTIAVELTARTSRLPSGLSAIWLAYSLPEPPIDRCHSRVPALLYLAINASALPEPPLDVEYVHQIRMYLDERDALLQLRVL